MSSEWLQHCCREPWQAADPLLGMHVVLAHIRLAGWQCVGHRHCRAKGIVAANDGRHSCPWVPQVCCQWCIALAQAEMQFCCSRVQYALCEGLL